MIDKLINRIKKYFLLFFLKLKHQKDVNIDKSITFRKRFSIVLKNGGKLCIGKNVFFNQDCSINVIEDVEIGNDCLFGENVKIYDHNHIFNIKDSLIRKNGYSCKKVIVGNNCWICSNVVLLPGANIGDNTVISAGCIVNSVIPSNSIVKNNNSYSIENINYNKVVIV